MTAATAEISASLGMPRIYTAMNYLLIVLPLQLFFLKLNSTADTISAHNMFKRDFVPLLLYQTRRWTERAKRFLRYLIEGHGKKLKYARSAVERSQIELNGRTSPA